MKNNTNFYYATLTDLLDTMVGRQSQNTNNINVIDISDCANAKHPSDGAIQYMLDNPNKKFLCVTQDVDEAYYIKEQCEGKLDILMPYEGPTELFDNHEDRIMIYDGYNKEIAYDLEDGSNVVAPHYIFRYSDASLRRLLMENGYTLIIDNVSDLCYQTILSEGDYSILEDVSAITVVDNHIRYNKEGKMKPSYCGGLRSMMDKMVEDSFFINADGEKKMWTISPEILCSTKSVMVFENRKTNNAFEELCEINNIVYSLGMDNSNEN